MSPRPPPKISLKHEWTRELGQKVAREPEGEVTRQPEGEVARRANFFQPTQPNPIRDRVGRPANMQDGRIMSRSQEIDGNSFNEEPCSSTERRDLLLLLIRLMRKTALEYVLLMKAICSTLMMKYFVKKWKNPLLVHDENHEPMMVNEADMDFRIPGLPHSVVKYAQSTSVRELIQKIENHPARHALQKDLQQNTIILSLSVQNQRK